MPSDIRLTRERAAPRGASLLSVGEREVLSLSSALPSFASSWVFFFFLEGRRERERMSERERKRREKKGKNEIEKHKFEKKNKNKRKPF